MHPVLAQHDILSLIFGQLADEMDEKLRHTSRTEWLALRSAALTCRGFQEPALDALWRTLDGSMLPLLRLIPNFRIVDGVWSLIGPVTDSMLLRYRMHASRVRKIRVLHGERVIDPSVYMRLRRALGCAILPSLQELCWFLDYEGPALSALVAPSLVRVYLSREPRRVFEECSLRSGMLHAQVVESFLYDLFETASCLRYLYLAGDVLPGVLSLTLPGTTRLESLTLRSFLLSGADPSHPLCLAYEDFLAFSRMANLVTLEIMVHKVRVPADAGTIKLPCLRDLLLYGSSSGLYAILKLLRPTELEQLRLSVKDDESYQTYQSLFQNIAFPTLLSIDLSIRVSKLPSEDILRHRDVLSLFSSLLRCHRLKRVNVYLVNFLSVSSDDSTLLSMAQAWPELIELDISIQEATFIQEDPSTAPTMCGLSAFSAHCPDLQSLSISLDPSTPFPASDSLPVSHHTLQSLQIRRYRGCQTQDPVEVARWIHALFPSVQRVSVIGDAASGDVSRMVKAFQTMPTVNEQQLRQSECPS
ncbi:hypothetical protein OE88DRAFT_1811572 [Heliocybe sulcata]|uniref:F-box domain-containing protein n=1 Tax=Heliocybe sulcata TaxID=5364 RepID=A0A5C3MPM5_9AGAM|nr:hypothetical protein OE88DRAFT_1811572 [Heliocybe sulcata]